MKMATPGLEVGSAVRSRRQGRASVGAWPATLMALAVFGAAIYAFSPRPMPPFPATAIGGDQLLIDGLAHQGGHWLAVGELGQIIYADAADGPWWSAQLEPQRGSTFTQVRFVDAQVALAVGHDSWIVRSEDGGRHWREVNFDPEQSTPLLGVAGPFGGKVFAFGAFGQMLVSTDLGKSWQKQSIETAAPAPAAAPGSDNPFGDLAADTGGDRHLNAMVQLGDGSLLLVGEKGLLMRSKDEGANWKLLPEIYKGSFFGALALPSKSVLAFGMRGHAFLSRDSGASWQAAEIPKPVSLFGATIDEAGGIDLVGDGNTLLRSTDGGAHFKEIARGEDNGAGLRSTLAAVLPVDGNTLLTAGDNGISLRRFAAGAPP